jgi:ribose transport system substrate-binding protein
VVPKGTQHDFWLTVKAGAEAAGEKNGCEILWQGPASEQDINGQIKIIENFTTSGVDGMVVAACSGKDLIDPLRKAKEKGIIIATIDSGIDDPDLPITYAATDNVVGGEKAAQELARLVGETGKVTVIPFIKGAESSDEREKGFLDEIRKHPGITVTERILYSDSDVNKAVTVTENLLTGSPDLAGIFAANEPGVKGALTVVRQRGLAGKVKLVGYDASPDQIQALRDGVVQALVVQDPFKMGYEGVNAVVNAKNGAAVEKRIDTGVAVVTPENIDTPEIQKLLSRPGK